MVASTYDDALHRLLQHEGGYTNHPSDPGGPTNFGITIADYRQYVKPGATAADVKAMRLDEAKAIYRAKYWDAQCCDALPPGVDYCVFDYGVNSGIGRSAKVLQRLIGVADDGAIGPATLAAVRGRDRAALVAAICDERLAFLKRLKTWPVFGTGWGRRVTEVRTVGLAMARDATTEPTAVSPSPARGKGVIPTNTAAQKSSAGAVIAAGGSAATQTNEPAAVLVIVAATILIAIGALLFWRWRQRRLQDAPI